MRSEIVFRPASAIGYHRFYVIRQIRGKGQWMVSRLNFSTSAEARVSILLYDALDFSTDRDDGGGQTRESLFRIASPSAAVAGIDPARFAHQIPRSRQDLRLAMCSNTASEGKVTSAAEIFFGPRSDDVKKNGRTFSRSAAVNSTYRRQKMRSIYRQITGYDLS
jgi:hypothetical protein